MARRNSPEIISSSGCYEIIGEVGRGQFGKALLVNDNKEDTFYIIKKSLAGAEHMVDCLNEVRVLSKLNHPRVIGFREAFYRKGSLHIVMALAANGDLGNYMRHHPHGIEPRQCIRWWAQMLEGLGYLHSNKILHRDMKMNNIFLDSQMNLCLGDFGISKSMGRYDFTNTILGTPYYMSPELLTGQPYHWASDIWAVGCIFVEMATGGLAFTGMNIQQLKHQVLVERKGQRIRLPAGYPIDIQVIIRRIFSLEWEKRPSVHEILLLPSMRNALANVNYDRTRSGSMRSQPQHQSMAARYLHQREREGRPHMPRDMPHQSIDPQLRTMEPKRPAQRTGGTDWEDPSIWQDLPIPALPHGVRGLKVKETRDTGSKIDSSKQGFFKKLIAKLQLRFQPRIFS